MQENLKENLAIQLELIVEIKKPFKKKQKTKCFKYCGTLCRLSVMVLIEEGFIALLSMVNVPAGHFTCC